MHKARERRSDSVNAAAATAPPVPPDDGLRSSGDVERPQTTLLSPAERVFLGTSGWAYPSWKPDFYPPRTSAKAMLAFYASQLNTVEVNYTFGRLPSPALVEGWMAQTPATFRFSFKAPQMITHRRRLRDCRGVLTAFAAALAPVAQASRLGVVLVQLPPNFQADAERLKNFLEDAACSKLPLAFEFRHSSWFSKEVFRLLERNGAALCLAESDELQTPQRQTAAFSCYRFRRSDYSTDELHAIAARLLEDGKRGEVYAYFKHEEAPDGPLRARNVLMEVRAGAAF